MIHTTCYACNSRIPQHDATAAPWLVRADQVWIWRALATSRSPLAPALSRQYDMSPPNPQLTDTTAAVAQVKRDTNIRYTPLPCLGRIQDNWTPVARRRNYHVCTLAHYHTRIRPSCVFLETRLPKVVGPLIILNRPHHPTVILDACAVPFLM